MGEITCLKSPFSDYETVALQAADEVKIIRTVLHGHDLAANVCARLHAL